MEGFSYRQSTGTLPKPVEVCRAGKEAFKGTVGRCRPECVLRTARLAPDCCACCQRRWDGTVLMEVRGEGVAVSLAVALEAGAGTFQPDDITRRAWARRARPAKRGGRKETQEA
ncbi:hypothetical protein AAFF_G00284260 [Aldrovandia affinis]|uniref:Uncharacterized protein n=1 Tax=Aldrovandia affinis TaxID=143900 RepID=A0AAD7TA55_9TELE|nr:hypothetical protein AAFF_G00284260 [Aldrovandia affinis]